MWAAWMASVLCALAVWSGARVVRPPGDKHGATSNRSLTWSAFGAGVLLVAVLGDFLPDIWDKTSAAPWCVLAGVLVLWAATAWSDRAYARIEGFSVAGAWVLGAALSFHSLVEGTALALTGDGADADRTLFLLAMVVHKLPEGVLWGMALMAAQPHGSPASARMARRVLAIPPLCTLAGTALGFGFASVWPPQILALLSAGVAGALLFIAMAELLPAVREHGLSQPRLHGWFFAGVGVMFMLTLATRTLGG
ncbi:ZIP family metal transporter [Alicyclobacillus sp.]|uniref:ZIP family metal transporter n=1 Tax=Alicyclobacillus sp. TaxID=61169 RepID=UPI0025B9DEAB|nr:ZIP family metal transporter [Alicyclobacillus sp.]MCL6517679.1 ZIP family metal transporter [Alicyclobacillus sp.]